jgi:hypothetical protein
MRAWLKGYKHGAFTQQPPVTILDRCNGIDLGMTLATTPVPPLPYYPAAWRRNHSTHHRVRRCESLAVFRQGNRPAHV